MKKRNILLILFLSFFIINIKVSAGEIYDSFYKGERIEGVTYSKFNEGRQNREAYIQRRSSDNRAVYCIEPFVTVKEDYFYLGTVNEEEILKKISPEILEKIKLIAYYGYSYPGHTESKWYSVTQIMMWRVLNPNDSFEWTDRLGGNIISPYNNEIAEIENLIADHYKRPSLAAKQHLFSIGTTVSINEKNVNLKDFEIIDSNIDAEIRGNFLSFPSDQVGDFFINIKRKNYNYNDIPIFYFDAQHQDLMSVGKLDEEAFKINITIESAKIIIQKEDFDTNTTEPQGEASLVGAVYDVFNSRDKLVGQIKIGENSTGNLENLAMGKYRIRESMSGNGYILDTKDYYIDLNHQTKELKLSLFNKVIKNEIIINKFFGTNGDFSYESGIVFEVYDKQGRLIDSKKTDINGQVKFTLVYGTYTIKQKNTTEGYYFAEDIIVDVNSENLLQEFDLVDLKIPNAYSEQIVMKIYYDYRRYA